MNRISNILWGFFFILLGIIFGLNALGITSINLFFSGWWTLFMIVPSFIGLFNDKDKTGNLIVLMIGICLLLACQGILQFEFIWKLIVPATLILIGLSILLKDMFFGKVKKKMKQLNKKGVTEYCACFSEQKLEFDEETAQNYSFNAIFGGIECNFRDAIIKDDIVLQTSSVFGGITIRVPKDVNVKITTSCIFGDVCDQRKEKEKNAKYTIYINASAIFGEVKVK